MTPRRMTFGGDPADYRHRLCNRYVDDPSVPCHKAAALHVYYHYDEELHRPMISYACEEHAGELGTVYLFEQAHPLGADCGMPNSRWSFAGNRCECNDTLGHDELFEEWMSTKVEELLRHLEGEPFPPEQVPG